MFVSTVELERSASIFRNWTNLTNMLGGTVFDSVLDVVRGDGRYAALQSGFARVS